MKRILTIALLLASLTSFAQLTGIDKRQTIIQLKAYNGTAAYVAVMDSLKIYTTCSPCDADETTVFAGTQNRNWTAFKGGSVAIFDTTTIYAQIAEMLLKSDTSDMLDGYVTTADLSDKADLVGGVVPTSQIPALAVTEFLGAVSSLEDMLELSGERGDWCIRTDSSRTYFLVAEGGDEYSDWQYLETPASPVTSVNGQSGVIVLGKSDIGLGNVANVDQTNASNTTSGTLDDGRLSGNVALRNATILPTSSASYDLGAFGTPWRNGYFSNTIGIGLSGGPAAGLHIIKTLEQFRSGYNTTNYWNAITSSTGITAFDAVGSSPYFSYKINGIEKFTVDANQAMYKSHLLPGTANSYDLGRTASGLMWRDLYLSRDIIAPNTPTSSTEADSAMAVNRTTGEFEMRPLPEQIETDTLNLSTRIDSAATALAGKQPTGTYGRQVFVSNVQLSHTGNANETTVYTATIPGGTMGLNGTLHLPFLGSMNSNGNSKTMRIRINGTIVASFAVTNSSAGRMYFMMSNRNSLTSQIIGSSATAGGPNVGFGDLSGAGVGTPNFNTANDMTVTVTVQLANGSDNMALEMIQCIVYP